MCPHNNYQCNIRTVNSSVVMEDGVTPPSSGSDVHVLDAVDNRSLHAHIVCRSSKYIIWYMYIIMIIMKENFVTNVTVCIHQGDCLNLYVISQ